MKYDSVLLMIRERARSLSTIFREIFPYDMLINVRVLIRQSIKFLSFHINDKVR